jgi:hypothetical protein
MEPGAWVKIERNGERFWVRVTAREGASILGIVDNHLLLNPWKCGDGINVSLSEVIETRSLADENAFVVSMRGCRRQ